MANNVINLESTQTVTFNDIQYLPKIEKRLTFIIKRGLFLLSIYLDQRCNRGARLKPKYLIALVMTQYFIF